MPHAFQREMWKTTRKRVKAETCLRRQQRIARIDRWLMAFQREWPFGFALFAAGIGCVVAAAILELVSLLPY
jgi:hypothetical protein